MVYFMIYISYDYSALYILCFDLSLAIFLCLDSYVYTLVFVFIF